ncbi:hypothetical protein CR513_31695, partial [Mucuna pruriens]
MSEQECPIQTDTSDMSDERTPGIELSSASVRLSDPSGQPAGGPSGGVAGSSAQGNQSPRRTASQNNSSSSPSSSSSSTSAEVFPFEIWYRDNSGDDTSTDPYSWVDLEVKKVFSTFTRGSALLGMAKNICQPGPWSVVVQPCRPDEPAHIHPSEEAVPFFFLYDTLPLKLGIKLPFTSFERSVLRALNVAPTQLHPNSWGFVRAFELICEDLGRAPSLGVFFWFFSLRKSAKVGWTSLSSRPKRKLLKPFLESFKVFKDRFFKVGRGAGGPSILVDNSGDPYFPLYWTPQPAVSVTVAEKDLEEWEKEFVAELHGFRVLSSAEIIKGSGFSVEYLKNWRRKLSRASAETSAPQPAAEQPAEDSLPPQDPVPSPQVVHLDSPNESPLHAGPMNEPASPHPADATDERPRKRLHMEFDDLFEDPPTLNEAPLTAGPLSPSLWNRSLLVGQSDFQDASFATDRSRVQRLGVKSTFNIFHQLAGCSLILARAAEAEFGELGNQVTVLSDQLAQAHGENKSMAVINQENLVKIQNYERTVDGLQGELRQASNKGKELLAAKSALEADRESLIRKVEGLSLTSQQLEVANSDSKGRIALMELELTRLRDENTTKDATILKQGSAILQQYEAGFQRALAQVKVLYPDSDTSEADPFKDIVDGRLVDVPTPPGSPVA